MSHARQTSILNLRPALWRFGPNTSFNPTAKKLRFFGSLAALGGGLIPALGFDIHVDQVKSRVQQQSPS
jgi:hypothetical protein